MSNEKNEKYRMLIEKIPSLTGGQLDWLLKVTNAFELPYEFNIRDGNLLEAEALESFGDALRIHHTFSAEPFSKDKFEYVLVQVLKSVGKEADLSPRGNPGHDITIDSIHISLKTQADKNIRRDKLWISKFMELGKGAWSDNPEELQGLREAFFRHMNNYERILILRALSKEPNWSYELVEIPKEILYRANDGKLEMKMDSTQNPKPGYCYVYSDNGELIFQLYFDAGSERKLQIKQLLKSYCIIHAEWTFETCRI